MNSKGLSLRVIRFCFLLILTPITVLSQDEYDRKISYSQLIKEIKEAEHKNLPEFELKNTEVDFDHKIDLQYSVITENFYTGNRDVKGSFGNIKFAIPIHFKNCLFTSYIGFENCFFREIIFDDCVFLGRLHFGECGFDILIRLFKCKVNDGISFFNSHAHQIGFESCDFEGPFIFNRSKTNLWFEFRNCTSGHGIEISNSVLGFLSNGLKIVGCNFNNLICNNVTLMFGKSKSISYKYEENNPFGGLILISYSNIPVLSLNKISPPDSNLIVTPTLGINESTIESLNLENSTFNGINFNGLSITKSTLIKGVHITHFISVMFFDYPKENSNMSWEFFSGYKLGVASERHGSLYQVKSDSSYKNEILYNELISGYNKFFHMYKDRGDITSANSCYIEMKDIETSKSKYLYSENPTIITWFNWRINQFLKKFCEYGTSPTKSIIISIWTILGFSIFYFFFYSDWDQINRTFLMKRFLKMLRYFRSEANLEDFYSEEHKEEYQTYKKFKRELEESKIEIPFFFSILGRPLYHLSLVRHKIITWLYRRTEILGGRWTDLKTTRKIFVGATVALAIMIYLIYLGLLRALNSTILSINTFSTLGFGDIPVKGFIRYIAVLQGFLGWFLLSIFSVSLISQILQN